MLVVGPHNWVQRMGLRSWGGDENFWEGDESFKPTLIFKEVTSIESWTEQIP